MYCNKCGKEIPDGSTFCQECGASQKTISTETASGLYTPKKEKKKKGKVILWIVLALLAIIIIAAIAGGGENDKSPSASAPGVIDPEESADSEPSSEPTAQPVQSFEEYAAECTTVGYKDLLRTPENYEGTKIKVQLQISQIMNSWGTTSYRCYSDNSGYGYYYDDEYYVEDCRVDSSLKLLEDDIITIYGEYAGTTEITRAIGGYNDELPQINMYYVELMNG